MKTFYNILFSDGKMLQMHSIETDVNLIQKFKDAKIEGNKFLSWDYGCLSMDNVFGIYTFPPYPPVK